LNIRDSGSPALKSKGLQKKNMLPSAILLLDREFTKLEWLKASKVKKIQQNPEIPFCGPRNILYKNWVLTEI